MDKSPFDKRRQFEQERSTAEQEKLSALRGNELKREQDLQLAIERMKKFCKDAAEYLKSNHVPTTTATTTIGAREFDHRRITTSLPRDASVTTKFPEGWVTTVDTAGRAHEILKPDGTRVMLCGFDYPERGFKVGDLVEDAFIEYSTHFEYDDDGPYLVRYDGMLIESGAKRPSEEEEFMRDILRTIERSKLT